MTNALEVHCVDITNCVLFCSVALAKWIEADVDLCVSSCADLQHALQPASPQLAESKDLLKQDAFIASLFRRRFSAGRHGHNSSTEGFALVGLMMTRV